VNEDEEGHIVDPHDIKVNMPDKCRINDILAQDHKPLLKYCVQTEMTAVAPKMLAGVSLISPDVQLEEPREAHAHVETEQSS